jgi:phosphoglycerate dehydrogenase-like enzyme
LEDFLEQCDIISIHAPSTKKRGGWLEVISSEK